MNTAAIKKLTTAKLVEFCAKDLRPFEIVLGEGFKKLIQHIWSMGAIYGDMDVSCILPHPTTISRNVAAIKEKKQQKILPVIEDAIIRGECSATTDMWTEDYKKNHFLTMTAHYFDENFTLKRKVLFTSLFKHKKKSGMNIRKELKNRFKKLGWNPKLLRKISFVTDQGSNVVKALTKPYTRDNCRAHLLNTILRNTFESESLPLVFTKTLGNCKKIVRYLKQSGKSNELSKGVVQECNTRWNYKLDMLNSVVERYQEILALLSVEQREKWSIDMELANDMVKFLTPFKEACKSMEGDTYPTANKILWWWGDLSEHLSNENYVRTPMKALVRIANKFFHKKYSVNMTNKIACFLDPRYRGLKMLTDDDRDEVYNEIKCLMEAEQNFTVETYSTPTNTTNNRFSRFEGRSTDDDEDEFELYIKTADYSQYLKNNKIHFVELFWKDNKGNFPKLYNMTRKRLHLPASSGSSERVFSDAGRTYEPRRTNLEPGKLDDLLFIRDHFEGSCQYYISKIARQRSFCLKLKLCQFLLVFLISYFILL